MCHSKLIILLETCERCCATCDVTREELIGGFVKFQAICRECSHKRIWENSDKKNYVPLINLAIASALLFTGCLPTKFLRALRIFNLATIGLRTYFRYQKEYLHGVSIIKDIYWFEATKMLWLPTCLLCGKGISDVMWCQSWKTVIAISKLHPHRLILRFGVAKCLVVFLWLASWKIFKNM